MLHIYQRTLNGCNIFYDLEDYLVFYTVFASVSRKYDLKVTGLCLMVDHLHVLVQSDIESVVSRFVSHYTSVFVKLYNEDVGRKGELFEKSFGRAWKRGSKKVRTAIAYLLNNPVEKSVCRRVEEYRWNFIAYADSLNPYSEQIPLRFASRALRRALKEVTRTASVGCHLNYVQLRRLLLSLDQKEREVLTDHIIMTYNVVDYKILTNYYGSYENLLLAVNSNTGSEYDIHETFHHGSDKVYREMASCIRKHCGISQVRTVTVLDVGDKISVAHHLQRFTSASVFQICKFLHMRVK
jgi:REP element-mobilizing transposase RayT